MATYSEIGKTSTDGGTYIHIFQTEVCVGRLLKLFAREGALGKRCLSTEPNSACVMHTSGN